MNVEVNKKFVLTWSTIATLSFTIIGFILVEYFEVMKDYMDTIKENQTELRLLKQKIDDDESQWQILQRQDEKIKSQEVQIEVLKIIVKRMSDRESREIVIKMESDSSSEVKKEKVEEKVEEKIFEDLEKKIDDLDRRNDYEDYRREQMIQQKVFPNQRNFQK